MEEAQFALRYPFSPQAKAFIEDVALTDNIVELGLERIRKALRGESSSRMVIHKEQIKEEVASFAAARMILGHLRNTFITGKFAVNESKVFRSRLDKEDESTIDELASYFGIDAKAKDRALLLDLPTYVSFSPRSPAYRLIGRRLSKGLVEISPKERNRLMEEAVKKHIERIPLVKEPPKSIKDAGERLLEELPRYQPKLEVKSGDHPPCIAKLLESAKRHENLPHHARWFLATYLLAISMDEESMVAIFANMPDFSEKVTRYQIAHARKKGYSVPACSTVMGYGLCCANCRIGTPLRWHSISSGRKEAIKG